MSWNAKTTISPSDLSQINLYQNLQIQKTQHALLIMVGYYNKKNNSFINIYNCSNFCHIVSSNTNGLIGNNTCDFGGSLKQIHIVVNLTNC